MSTDSEKPFYVGNAKEIHISGRDSSGLKIELDLDAMNAFMDNPDNQQHIRTWRGRDGAVHRTLNLAAWPLKPEHVNDRKTHSVKIDTWKPDPAKRGAETQAKVTSSKQADFSDDNTPF